LARIMGSPPFQEYKGVRSRRELTMEEMERRRVLILTLG
jgi:hypothetical protein